MRRRFCLNLLTCGATLSLTACGFALRRAPNFPFKTLFSPFSESSVLGIELKRSLESNGNVRVITDVRQIDQADVILDVLTDRREKVVVGRNYAHLPVMRSAFVAEARAPALVFGRCG